ncbi:O-acetyl-ADP-ribose deacetylase (regulator of RNase III) [Mucilaginibacter rubeus]|uniref:O-acetyl-ADP-ribose deacetylase n=1 Tax=Mucilaginibacter rubeus TaxID=2027860 RepID=UPI00339A8B7E
MPVTGVKWCNFISKSKTLSCLFICYNLKYYGTIELVQGDITKIKADAIVNAANTSLMGGGGVDGVIHRAGGPEILEDCRKIVARQGGCKTGQAVITTGGKLPAKYVIHTVGPVYNSGKRGEDELLQSAYLNSLKLAAENDVHTIVFPNISTGIYHFPKDRAAAIAVKTVKDFLSDNEVVEKVIFVCFDNENYSLYNKLLT